MTMDRKLLVVSFSLILIAAAIVAVYLYQAEQQQQVEEATAIVEVAIEQFKQKQYKTVIETLDKIPQDVIKDWRASYYRGATLIKLKDFEPAALALEKALILNNEQKDIPFALGIVYYKLGNLSLSKSYFHSVLEIDPNHKEAKGLMDIMAKLERNPNSATTPKSH